MIATYRTAIKYNSFYLKEHLKFKKKQYLCNRF